jgi:hypothetical protein
MDINVAQAFASFVFGAAGVGVGAFLVPYLNTKGTNVATHEDISKLVDQVAAVTKTTKEIEAKISNEVWDRQKQWEFKKEAVFDVLKALGSLHSAVSELHSAYKSIPLETTVDAQLRLEAYEKYKDIYNEFTRASVVAGVVCGKNVSERLSELEVVASHMARYAAMDNVTASKAKVEEFTEGVLRIQMALRLDLGIGPP